MCLTDFGSRIESSGKPLFAGQARDGLCPRTLTVWSRDGIWLPILTVWSSDGIWLLIVCQFDQAMLYDCFWSDSLTKCWYSIWLLIVCQLTVWPSDGVWLPTLTVWPSERIWLLIVRQFDQVMVNDFLLSDRLTKWCYMIAFCLAVLPSLGIWLLIVWQLPVWPSDRIWLLIVRQFDQVMV